LKKNELQPHLRKQWVIPPEADSAFVAAMEDVLEVYMRPRNPLRPLVCLDEASKQLTIETRIPLPMEAGRPERFDYEYERNGTANLFITSATKVRTRRLFLRRPSLASGANRNTFACASGLSTPLHKPEAQAKASPPSASQVRMLVAEVIDPPCHGQVGDGGQRADQDRDPNGPPPPPDHSGKAFGLFEQSEFARTWAGGRHGCE
jgi:hypothetical protein